MNTKKELQETIVEMQDILDDSTTTPDIADAVRASMKNAKKALQDIIDAEAKQAELNKKKSEPAKAATHPSHLKTFSEIKNKVHDLSGIDNADDYLYELTNGVYYPTQKKTSQAASESHAKPAAKAAGASRSYKKKRAAAKALFVKKATIASQKKKANRNVAAAHARAHELVLKLTKSQKVFNKGRSKDEIKRDASKKALHPGYRKSASGHRYYEGRPNRSDISGRKPYLEQGGEIKGGGSSDIKNAELKRCVKALINTGDFSFQNYEGKWRWSQDNESVLLKCDQSLGKLYVLVSFFPEEDTLSYQFFTSTWLGEGERVQDSVASHDWNTDDESIKEFVHDIIVEVSDLQANYESADEDYARGGQTPAHGAHTALGVLNLGGQLRQSPAQGANYRWQNDKAVEKAAKPVGWRYTDLGAARLGVSANKTPTAADVSKYSGKTFRSKGGVHRYIYQETRKDKSDLNQRKHLASGGQLSGSTITTDQRCSLEEVIYRTLSSAHDREQSGMGDWGNFQEAAYSTVVEWMQENGIKEVDD